MESLIIIHNYNTNNSNIIAQYKSKMEAYGFIEEFIDKFINSEQGSTTFNYCTDIPSKYQLKYGYFVLRKPAENINKYTIINRVRTVGYFYNNIYNDVKIFDIMIATLKNPGIINGRKYEFIYNEADYKFYQDIYESVLDKTFEGLQAKQELIQMINQVEEKDYSE